MTKTLWIILFLIISSLMLNAGHLEKNKKDCVKGSADACSAVGYLYQEGILGVSKNYSKAKKYYKKACEMDANWGCRNLGEMYYKGTGVRQDYYKAKELYLKSCNAGNDYCCYLAANMFIDGKGGKKDFHKAHEIAVKTCGDGKIGKGDNLLAGKLKACMMLGIMYEIGIGVNIDITKAKNYYGNICDQGREEGCRAYARLNTM